MLKLLYYTCLCFALIYMIHSIFNHFRSQFVQKNNPLSFQPIPISNEKEEFVNKSENIEEMNKMKEYFQSLK